MQQRQQSSIVVVGGGVLGLISARALARHGYQVTVVEAGNDLGGLTATHTLNSDAGPLNCDRFYHVVLESDRRLLALLGDLGLSSLLRWTTTSAIVAKDGHSHPASSLPEMAQLPVLSLADRLRVGLSIGASLLLPPAAASRFTADSWLRRWAGASAADNFWTPILRAKLGTAANAVSAEFVASTFRRLVQARLRATGDRFGIIDGGYAAVFRRLRDELEQQGVRFLTGTPVTQVRSARAGVDVVLENGTTVHANRAVLTAPGPIIAGMVPDLSDDERTRLTGAPYLGVVCAALLLREPPNDAYITYLIDDVGLTGVIGMHALMDTADAAQGYLVYLPRYCAPDDPWFDEPDDAILERMLHGAAKALPDGGWDVLDARVSRARHVVPLPTPQAPQPIGFRTTVPGVYVLSAAQNTTGTLNVEGSLALAAQGLNEILKENP